MSEPLLALLIAGIALPAAVIGWARAWHWHQSYRGALELYRSIPRQPERTPHQRGAETAKQRRIEAMRAHRMALERDIQSKKEGAA